jgi:hypothetical protein
MTYQRKAPFLVDPYMTVEQLYTKLGADAFAKLMAAHLRQDWPRREILDAVVRLLDPPSDDDLKLVIERRSRGNPKLKGVKRIEEIEIAQEVENFLEEYLAAGNPKRGSIKFVAGKIAGKRGIKANTVEQTHRKIRRIIKKNTLRPE